MEKVKVFEGVVKSVIINEIKDANWCTDLVQYATCKCGIDGLIAAADLFCPQIIQIKDYIFIKRFWNCSIEDSVKHLNRLKRQCHNDKKAIEMSVTLGALEIFL